MKNICLALIIFLGFSMINYSQDIQSKFASYGEIIKVKLENAPFPHPKRANGHQYKDKTYPADIHYSDNSTAFFIPANYKQTDNVDIVIHFHGWGNCIDSTFTQFDLVDQFCKSNKNAILVIPEGPKNAPDSFGGKLEDKDGFSRFVKEAIDKLYDLKKIKTKNIGKIILSGHSGGYHVMSYILMHGGMPKEIKEIYLFDALYGGTEKFIYWLDHFGGKCINIYTTNGGTKEESESMMECFTGWGIPFISKTENEITDNDLKNNKHIFIYTDLTHNEVIYKRGEFYKYLSASCLDDIK